MPNIFFVSDMHFGHLNILKYCTRPWPTIPEMNEGLVENWNATVGLHDTVYHLGDWAFHDYECIGRLNGNLISIPGNHDREREKKLRPFLPNGFTEEVHYLKIDSVYRFVLCHYPFESWWREYRFHLHGHAHGQARDAPFRLDVGIDAAGLFRPLALEEVVAKLIGEPK